ncbi:MAG: hypothetical protein IPF53_15840 [Blastocatellia bacterium]|nr:hypothetical protein [Blastocatellia bacterium]
MSFLAVATTEVAGPATSPAPSSFVGGLAGWIPRSDDKGPPGATGAVAVVLMPGTDVKNVAWLAATPGTFDV